MPEHVRKPTRILRLPEVKRRTGLGTTSIYDKLSKKSRRHDPTFPKPITLGEPERRARAIGWIEGELEAWIEQQIARSRQSAA